MTATNFQPGRYPQVKKVTRNGRTVEVEGIGSFVSLMAAKLVSHGIVPNDLRTRQPSLEDVFETDRPQD